MRRGGKNRELFVSLENVDLFPTLNDLSIWTKIVLHMRKGKTKSVQQYTGERMGVVAKAGSEDTA